MNLNKYIEEAMANIEYYGTCSFTEGKPNKPPKLLIEAEEKYLRRVLSEALAFFKDDVVEKLIGNINTIATISPNTNEEEILYVFDKEKYDNLIKELTE